MVLHGVQGFIGVRGGAKFGGGMERSGGEYMVGDEIKKLLYELGIVLFLLKLRGLFFKSNATILVYLASYTVKNLYLEVLLNIFFLFFSDS